ncbi:hypothetical protein GGI07_002052 [Coemansia sp. Benny D115]|nr:hypothetical protein GGI07_002052 [Coemansia sp. Benny D115]
MAPYFFPPMWEQRRLCVARTIYAHKAQRVLEVGCGGGNILSFLAAPAPDDEHPIVELIGIDTSTDALALARQELQPKDHDLRDLRVDALHIALHHGDGTGAPLRGVAVDAVVCSEVIEHIAETQVALITQSILGGYRPRIAVFTTPNAEFNVNFPGLRHGTPEARMRDADHKFEWTRSQFSRWALDSAERFGYSVELSGVGMTMRNADASFVDCGGCTQMAVFVRREEPDTAPGTAQDSGSLAPQPALFADIEYPVFQGPVLTGVQLAELARSEAELAALADDDEGFSVERLWDRPEIRQQFRRRRALGAWLAASTEHFALVSGSEGSAKEQRYRAIVAQQ